jgi:hypothetical protein
LVVHGVVALQNLVHAPVAHVPQVLVSTRMHCGAGQPLALVPEHATFGSVLHLLLLQVAAAHAAPHGVQPTRVPMQ